MTRGIGGLWGSFGIGLRPDLSPRATPNLRGRQHRVGGTSDRQGKHSDNQSWEHFRPGSG